MNYEEARQIAEDGPAPGKWNWTNLNDSIAPYPYTIAPCGIAAGERCDHDTREEAERHRYEWIAERLQEGTLAEEQRPCELPLGDRTCGQWTQHYLQPFGEAGAWAILCDEHRTAEGWRAVNPFRAEVQVIHS